MLFFYCAMFYHLSLKLLIYYFSLPTNPIHREPCTLLYFTLLFHNNELSLFSVTIMGVTRGGQGGAYAPPWNLNFPLYILVLAPWMMSTQGVAPPPGKFSGYTHGDNVMFLSWILGSLWIFRWSFVRKLS